MGAVNKMTFDNFPEQGNLLRKDVDVYFHNDTGRPSRGEVMRNDVEAPFVTIIRLDGGKYVLASECQYRLR